jgi:hypothetical protein
MSSFLINALTHPLGQDLFCQFFNEGQVPLPPPGSAYFIEEDLSNFFITENGLDNFITE